MSGVYQLDIGRCLIPIYVRGSVFSWYMYVGNVVMGSTTIIYAQNEMDKRCDAVFSVLGHLTDEQQIEVLRQCLDYAKMSKIHSEVCGDET